MAIIIDFYKENKFNANEIKNAEEYLLVDTLSKNLKGEAKIKELDGMDIESKLVGNIVPSMIYTFIYDTKKDLQMVNDVIFGDNMPIVLCCDVKPIEKIIDGKIVKSLNLIGINFNFLRPEQRAVVIDVIYSTFSKFYDNVHKDVLNNRISINKNLGNILKDNNFVKTIYNLTRVDVSKCVRSYNISYAKNIRLVEYNLWKYIPLYEAQRTVSDISIKQLQEIISKK